MFCLRNGVGDEEEKEEEGVIFEFLFCASDLAGRGRLVRKGQHVSFVAPASSSIYRLYNFFYGTYHCSPVFCLELWFSPCLRSKSSESSYLLYQ